MRDEALLHHIRDAAEAVLRYTESGEAAFLSSQLHQDAVVRQLMIIGEATKKLSDETRDRAPHIPWKDIMGMRDLLIHDYFGVSLEEVWSTAEKNVPVLLAAIQAMLDESEGRKAA